jgi:hypothetical protein
MKSLSGTFRRFFLIILIACLSSPSFRSHAASPDLINPKNISLRSEAIHAENTAEISHWLTDFKSRMNQQMLDPSSPFGQFLKNFRTMTQEERHLLSYGVELRPIAGLDNAYIALFYSRLHMTRSLIRSVLYSSGGLDARIGEIPPESCQYLHESLEACRGLKLVGQTLQSFSELVKKNDGVIYPEEEAFRTHILAKLKTENLFIVAANVVGFSMEVLEHELAHVRFAQDDRYRKIVIDYWNQKMSAEEQEAVKGILSRGGYNVQVLDLVIDEFQAFLLQSKEGITQSNIMEKFVAKHRQALMNELTQKSCEAAL